MDILLQDLRYSIRLFLKNPGFTLASLMCLALGIGVNTAVFSVVNAALFRSLPYAEPDRLYMVYETNFSNNITRSNFSLPDFLDYRQQSETFQGMAAYEGASITMTGGDEPERIQGARVSPSLFPVLGVQPAMGRTFTDDEEKPGGNLVLVISHSLWERRFGFDPDILNKKLILDGGSFTIVGVMPRDFQFPINQKAEAWTPLSFDPTKLNRGSHSFQVIGRLKPNVTAGQAAAELDTIGGRLAQQYPDTNTGWASAFVELNEFIVGQNRQILYILLATVAFVLLIACANVANLLLARSAARQKEIAVRASLGATRANLIRQLLTESIALSLIGGILGLILAYWGTNILVAYIPANLYLDKVGIDGTVLGFTLLLSILTGIIFGLAPALQISKADLNETLKEEGRGSTTRHGKRLRSFLVVSEVALALVLLIGAALLIRSLMTLQAVDPGFKKEGALTMQIGLPRSRYPQGPQQAVFFQRLLEQVKGAQGIESAGLINYLPLGKSNANITFTIEGRQPASPTDVSFAGYRIASPDYFRSMAIPLLSGRAFTDQDTDGAPEIVIINNTMAKRFWPDEDPIGKRLKFGNYQSNNTWRTVVGVIGDVKHFGLNAKFEPEIYTPFQQDPASSMTLVVRTQGAPLNSVNTLRSEVQTVDKNQPVHNVRTLEAVVADAVSGGRGYTILLAMFSVLSLILAAVGIYGVMSHSVAQRTQEIGIRMALGARPADVLKLVVRQGMVLAAIGLLVGLIGALGLTRFISSFLFGISVMDITSYAVICAVLAVVALFACYIPARKAMAVDPAIALRHQ